MDKYVLGLIAALTTTCSNIEQPLLTEPIVLNETRIVVEPRPIRQQLLVPFLEQIRQQSIEMLPFDEPKNEYGLQLDGSLRPEWERAYRRGQRFYVFNHDKYPTMHNGKPFVPQVCADFIVDTIDRTAGTWYVPSLRTPSKMMGRYDVRLHMTAEGLSPRRVAELLEFFKRNPSKFDFVFEGLGPTTNQTHELKSWMKTLNVEMGDLIIIRGKVPWDHGREEHWHSFFVTGLDELGQVQLVTGNPIYPVERTLRVEGNRTPKRRVTHIIRITDDFMGQITGLLPAME